MRKRVLVLVACNISFQDVAKPVATADMVALPSSRLAALDRLTVVTQRLADGRQPPADGDAPTGPVPCRGFADKIPHPLQ